MPDLKVRMSRSVDISAIKELYAKAAETNFQRDFIYGKLNPSEQELLESMRNRLSFVAEDSDGKIVAHFVGSASERGGRITMSFAASTGSDIAESHGRLDEIIFALSSTLRDSA